MFNRAAVSRRTGLIAFGGVAIAALALSVAAHLFIDYRSEIGSARALNEKLALALEVYTRSVFYAVDHALVMTTDQLKSARRHADDTVSARAEILTRTRQTYDRLHSLALIDPAGQRTYTTIAGAPASLDLSDRDYFIAQRDHPDLGMFIGVPVAGRSSGDWVIPVSERLVDDDGRFAGVIQATVPAEAFDEFIRSLQIGNNGSVGIGRLDGEYLIRRPAADTIGRSFANAPMLTTYLPQSPVGTYRINAVVDGVDRIISYRSIPSLGLIVYVARAVDEVLTPWYRDLRTLSAIWLICAAIITALTARMVRQAAAQDSAEAALNLSERRFRALIEQSNDMVIVVRPDGIVAYRSPSTVELLGYASEDVIDRPVLDRIHPEDAGPFANEFRRVAGEPGSRAAGCVRIRHKDGSWRDIEWTARNAIDVAGIEGVVINSRDVTARKLIEGALETAKTAAETANRAKSSFLANMSHELRTPLNAIIGFSEIIRSATLGPMGTARYREYAADINAAGQHLLDIVNDVLDLSKLEANKFRLREEECDVGETIAAIVNMLREAAESGKIRVDTDVPQTIPRLWADSLRVRQILTNLLSNAVKFTSPGGRVSVRVSVEDSGELALSIRDTGIGMTLEQIEIALEPFGQVDIRTNRKFDGTGLGLPIAKRWIELHGGRLEIVSTPAVGTEVTVRLPRSRLRPIVSRTAVVND